jgi:hypothetical protein
LLKDLLVKAKPPVRGAGEIAGIRENIEKGGEADLASGTRPELNVQAPA